MPIPQVKQPTLLEAAFAVRKAVFVMDKLVDRALAESGGPTLMQMMILRTIEVVPHITQRELSGVMNLTEAAVSRQIDALLKKGLVKREKIPDERRAMALSLTALGEKELLDAMSVGYGVIERHYEQVPKHDLQTVRQVFEKMCEGLQVHCHPSSAGSSVKSDSIAK